ncbi:MAG: hypothetical protein ACR2IS_04155 [Nitrososphaeraceae archaeon]
MIILYIIQRVSKSVQNKDYLLPDGVNNDMEPAVSYPPDPLTGKQPIEVKGTFDEFQKKGIRLKSYEERGADGRIINQK